MIIVYADLTPHVISYTILYAIHMFSSCPIFNSVHPVLYYILSHYDIGPSYIAGYRKREIQAMVEDHLKLLITQHFDPKKADLIFTEEGSVSCLGAQYYCTCV